MPRHTGRSVDYVVQLKGNVHIQIAEGYQGMLGNYPCVQIAMPFCLGRGIVPVWRWQSTWHCTETGHREPWYLATLLPDAGGK